LGFSWQCALPCDAMGSQDQIAGPQSTMIVLHVLDEHTSPSHERGLIMEGASFDLRWRGEAETTDSIGRAGWAHLSNIIPLLLPRPLGPPPRCMVFLLLLSLVRLLRLPASLLPFFSLLGGGGASSRPRATRGGLSQQGQHAGRHVGGPQWFPLVALVYRGRLSPHRSRHPSLSGQFSTPRKGYRWSQKLVKKQVVRLTVDLGRDHRSSVWARRRAWRL